MSEQFNVLPSGSKMPLVGLGTWKIPTEKVADTVYNAIKLGYRLFDGAEDYGNEKLCGEGVKRAIDEGIVKREDLFITSKLWNTFHHPDNVEAACKRSLDDWGLEYFDLFLIHFPISLKYVDPAVRYPPGWNYDVEAGTIEFEDVPVIDTWRAMEKLVDDGLVRNIGVSNFSGGLLYDLLRSCRIKPASLQIEHHPYLVQQPLVDYAQKNGIAVTGYSTFGPASYIQLDHGQGVERVTELEPIKAIATKYSRTPAQVVLRWATQRGIHVNPMSTSEDNLRDNLNSFGFDLTEEELKTISGYDKNFRFNDPYDWPPTGIPIFV